MLSDDEIAAYQRDGFLRPRFRLSTSEVAQLQAMVDRLIADNPHVSKAPFTSMHAPEYSPLKLNTDGRAWLDVCRKPKILDIVEQLIGPDIIFWGSQLFHKDAYTGGLVHYHRDAFHYPIEPLVTPNIWIAITPSTLENGCVKFVPGSHLSQERGRHTSQSDDPSGEHVLVPLKLEDAFNEADAVAVELEAGEMYISDPFIIHGSAANKSPHPRTGLAMRYFPTTSVYDHTQAPGSNNYGGASYNSFAGRPLFLVRGIDRSGKNDFSIGHPQANGGLVAHIPIRAHA